MEVFPPKKDTDFEMVKEAALHIASLKPSFMSVTYGAGGSTKGNTIKLASEIQKQYQVPAMAHLTCVCATKESINTALTEMKHSRSRYHGALLLHQNCKSYACFFIIQRINLSCFYTARKRIYNYLIINMYKYILFLSYTEPYSVVY